MTHGDTNTVLDNDSLRPDPDSGKFVEVTELLHADAGTVNADRIAIEQSTANSVTARTVEITQSAIRSVSSEEARLEQTAMLLLKSSDTAVHESAIGVIKADRIDLLGTTAGLVLGSVNVAEGARSRILVQIGGGANRPQPILDGQSALRLGAGLGVSLLVFGRLMRRVLGN
jgi:hypothetical protein